MKLKLFVAISFICGFALAFSGCTGNTDSGISDPYSGYENVSFKISEDFQEGLNFLNAVRADPASYSEAVGVDLSGIESRPALTWNEALAKAAARKAQDMADRNYFGHVDPDGYGMNYFIDKAGYELRDSWLSEKSANNFESIAAGTYTDNAKDAIKMLLNDGGASNDSPNAGHRHHLLGMKDFWANCYDIGIGHGYSESSQYKNYWCILVAKHNF